MSNVLIGIIGVILFIGLAVAGALYLGDRFTSAGNESRAAATISQIAQISNAIQMYEMKTGQTFTAGTSLGTLMPRFLRSLPSNPTTGPVPETYTAQVVSSGGRTSLVLMELGTRAEAVCQAISRQSGLAAIPVANDVASVPGGNAGCFRTSAVIGNARSSVYYAYNRTWAPQTASPTPGKTCTPGPKGNCIVNCIYVDPRNPGVAISGYCDQNGNPI